MRASIGLSIIATVLLLTACGGRGVPEDEASISRGKGEITTQAVVAPVGETIGTAMAERVAVLGLLNKRNGQTRDIELKPGESVRLGKVEVRLRACEKTAPWETFHDQGAFVQMIIRERPTGTNDAERWHQVFSGWLFKENPAANIVQHPVFDVWVKECRMSFPGEEEAVEKKPSSDATKPPANKPSSVPQAADTQAVTAEPAPT